MSKPIQIAIFAVAAVALSGGGFFAGMNARVAGESKDAAAASASPTGRRTGAFGAAGGQEMASGRVIAVNDDSITVAVNGANGQRSIIALVGGAQRIVRTTETTIKPSDIKVGDDVLVSGVTDASSGAVTANTVIVGVSSLQQLFGGGQGGGRTGAPSASGAQRRSPAPSPTP